MTRTPCITGHETSQPVLPGNAGWWLRRVRSMRLRQPVAEWLSYLMDAADDATMVCPRCPRPGTASETVDHLLCDHECSYSEAAGWLETIDADLYALAVHYLVTKDRAARSA